MKSHARRRPKARRPGMAKFVADVTATLRDFGEALSQAGRAIQKHEMALSGVLDMLDERKVKEAATRRRVRNDVAAMAKAEAEGKVKREEVAGPGCIVVGREVDKDGYELNPRVTAHWDAILLPAMREKLMGAGPGTDVATPAGGRFIVLEIWRPVTPPTGSAHDDAVDVAELESRAETP